MTRHLTTLALGGILSVCLMAGDAEACHKKKCGCAPVACAPAPVVCARPVPAPCPKPVRTTCAPRVQRKGCLSGLFAGFGHKKSCAPAPCAAPVAYAYSYPTVAPSGQYYPTPQATGQSYMPPVPTKH